MTITMCDGCGRRLTTWVSVETRVSATFDYQSIGDLLNFQHRSFQYCKDCATERFVRKEKDET